MFRRLSVLVLAALTLIAVAAPSASAGSSYMSRTTGKNANAYWTQVDGTPLGSAFGNVHIGSLYAYETSKNVGDAFVYIEDWDCEAGQLPYWGHEAPEAGCTYVGTRYGNGFAMTFVVDRKLNTASLQGTIEMSQGGGHDGPGQVIGRPSVDMVWTGTGSLSKGTSTYRYNDGTTSYSDRYRSTDRQASVDGLIGSMSFAPDSSGGSISTFTSMSRGRS